ncbi:hypothetical protein Lser_V15G40225 [Lactuca serriola]
MLILTAATALRTIGYEIERHVCVYCLNIGALVNILEANGSSIYDAILVGSLQAKEANFRV